MSRRVIDNRVYGLACVVCELVFGRLYRCPVEGLELVPESGRVLLASNHLSIWDPVLLAWAASTRRMSYFLGKAEVFRNPVLGWFLRKVHSIPLDRSRGDVAALRRAAEVLEGEGCLSLYPEGTRWKGGPPLKPKPGIGFLACEYRAPVVPVRVWGTQDFLRPGARLRVKFGAPLRFGEGPGETPDKEGYRAFAQRVMDAVFSL